MSHAAQEGEYEGMRNRMVDLLRAEYNIRDEAVLRAMARVRRHKFIPEKELSVCNPYGDYPCPIGYDQTISQPFIVAYMTGLLEIGKGDRVLDVGSGSGYQAAILAEMGADVFSVEIIPRLAMHAGRILAVEGYGNVHVLTGDGYKGWSEYAPYDAIVVTCAPEFVPDELAGQLKEGGRMVVPVGIDIQTLVVLRRKRGKIISRNDIMVRFVPMVPAKAKKKLRSSCI